jgi:hypothetical protein|tara:strand:+ start:58 stop:309 length:252 start_codon:yes stop_codon:yes gene_type:complete
MGRRKGSRILSASKSYWNKFKTNPEDIAALKKFIDTADEDDTSLKIQLLGWMFDNINKINIEQMRDKKFHQDVLTWLHLIERK